MSSVERAVEFDAGQYLEQRRQSDDFVMVEFGHDSFPVAYMQADNGVELKGQRAYIGIEGWLRDSLGASRRSLAGLHDEHCDGQNIFYIEQELGGTVARADLEGIILYDQSEYDPTTILPDGAADEIVASNVLTDPMVSDDRSHSLSLLAEMSRVVDEDGIIVLRETTTPWRGYSVKDENLAFAGLERFGVVDQEDTEQWDILEDVYGPEFSIVRPRSGSYYMFLGRA